jgi:hypothetical protein
MSRSEEIVRRRIPLSRACSDELTGEVMTIDGVRQARCKGRGLRLQYDVRQVDLSTIEGQLQRLGMDTRPSRYWRIKRAFYRYLDSNIRAVSGSSDAACCSNPHDIYASRKK